MFRYLGSIVKGNRKDFPCGQITPFWWTPTHPDKWISQNLVKSFFWRSLVSAANLQAAASAADPLFRALCSIAETERLGLMVVVLTSLPNLQALQRNHVFL